MDEYLGAGPTTAPPGLHDRDVPRPADAAVAALGGALPRRVGP